jgi:hypothetical protein
MTEASRDGNREQSNLEENDIIMQLFSRINELSNAISSRPNGLFHLISVPPPLSRIHVFHSYTPEEFQAQNCLPLNNSKLKTLYP